MIAELGSASYWAQPIEKQMTYDSRVRLDKNREPAHSCPRGHTDWGGEIICRPRSF